MSTIQVRSGASSYDFFKALPSIPKAHNVLEINYIDRLYQVLRFDPLGAPLHRRIAAHKDQ
ncbi:MAG TPA: hypothetical protein VFA89_18785 [Terriglobales bacterium]|nr:hypothetical protein [Terriglobales bacterium]